MVKQALAQGHTVKAFGRNVKSLIDEDLASERLEAIKGSVFEPTEVRSAVKGSDAVISVVGGSFDGLDRTRSLGIKTIIAQMAATGVNRIVALGGLGILNADEQTLLIDNPGYPEEFKPVGKEHLQAYLYLKESDLDWTFVCAPNIGDKNATGKYHTNKNYPPIPNSGNITAGDLAAFIIDETTNNQFVQLRVGISN